jgi:hypothetical protein
MPDLRLIENTVVFRFDASARRLLIGEQNDSKEAR